MAVGLWQKIRCAKRAQVCAMHGPASFWSADVPAWAGAHVLFS